MNKEELIRIAENDPDDKAANLAMQELRNEFDETHFWYEDCLILFDDALIEDVIKF